MSKVLRILLVLIVLILVLAGGAWWYLFGPNKMAAAELVPADTIAFATIPNATPIVLGYQTSHLKQLVDSPNAKPLVDQITKTIGQKNLDLIESFAPSLSGQSFIAVTHFDADHPEQIGLIGGLKPKAGMADFNAFVEKLKAAYPDEIKQGTTGAGNVAGVDYQWIKGPEATDKVCVAQYRGWIITAWGEATLQDWIERLQKKATTPSLAQDPDYQKSLERVGKTSMTVAYVNYKSVATLLQKQLAKTNPASSDYLAKKIAQIGGFAIGTQFDQGDIVDRFSVSIPRQAQLDSGMSATPCPFETLKFTALDTRLYWASSMNWKQYFKALQEETAQTPQASSIIAGLQALAQGAGIDLQHNIIDALGSEISIQADWTPETLYPEVGLFVKLDKPDDFKPVTAAIIDLVRKNYGNLGRIQEIKAPDHNFASLKFVESIPVTPTITEDGPYFGFFLTQGYAVRAFSRGDATGLTHNADFLRQIGDKRNGAYQILFLDSPQLLDHAYRTALPYVSMLSMFNAQIAAMLKNYDLPADLTWLAPMGTWSYVVTADDQGITGYSTSGIGNQGILLAAVGGGAASALQASGLLPKSNPMNPAPMPSLNPAPPPASSAPSPTPADATIPPAPIPAAPNATSMPASSPAPPPAPAAPDATAAPASAPAPSATVPEATPAPAPAAPTDAAAPPAPTPDATAPATPPAPATPTNPNAQAPATPAPTPATTQ